MASPFGGVGQSDAAEAEKEMRLFGDSGYADRMVAAFNEPIEVLVGNWEAVRVYQLCQHPIALGMAGLFLQSIPTVEVESACRARGVPFTEEIVGQVTFLGNEIAAIRNRQNSR